MTTPSKQDETPTESQAWIPKTEGDTLTGEVVEVIRAWSDARTNGGRDMERGWYPLIRVRDDEGNERDWHAFTAVSEARVMDKRPLPGERITVTYLGESDKAPPKGQSAPKLWRLTVDGRDPVQEATNVYDMLAGGPTRGTAPPPEGTATPEPELPF